MKNPFLHAIFYVSLKAFRENLFDMKKMFFREETKRNGRVVITWKKYFSFKVKSRQKGI